ncbi:hypothetical protein TSAR_010310 [Trichomalopsis sarcophagae]|uniref:Uncharacterized protein n=1 Tax=Trichomalopsis sarcophagae TaxID=543379 RepID=A0A232EHL7_9HYME|nr:hypothetical protein TSAR_010310 [Trichomalopsis sarcophagae]
MKRAKKGIRRDGVNRYTQNMYWNKKKEVLTKEVKEAKEDRSGKKFWNMVKRRRRGKREQVDKEIENAKWLEHFKGQLGERERETQREGIREIEEPARREIEEEEREIEVEEGREIIRKLKEKKAPGDDGIQNEAWKYGEENLVEQLTEILGKIEEENRLSDTQMGFRKGRGTIDAIYVVSKAVEQELRNKGGKVHACFADMKAASDKINREEIWIMMKRLGVRMKIRERVEDIYEKTECEVNIGEKK